MKETGKYCKAYAIDSLKDFGGWTESLTTAAADERPSGSQRGGEYVFIHEDYTVTRSIFLNEEVLFNQVTSEWVEFCKTKLRFEIPAFKSSAPPSGPGAKIAVQQPTTKKDLPSAGADKLSS